MGRKLSIGDIVTCRYFNIPDNRFYGVGFTGVILDTDYQDTDKSFLVQRTSDGYKIALRRKEIKRRIGRIVDNWNL